MIVRYMTSDDIEQVYNIAKVSFPDKCKYKDFEKALTLSYNICLVAEAEEQVIGFCLCSQLFETADLNMIAVSEANRRNKLGEKILIRLLELLEEREAEHILLEVRESNDAAIGLYRKRGFLPISTRKEYYTNPVEDAVIMEKILYA